MKELVNKLDKIIEGITHKEMYSMYSIFVDLPFNLYGLDVKCPLLLMKNHDGTVTASDLGTIIKYARNEYFLDDKKIFELLDHCLDNYKFEVRDNMIELTFKEQYLSQGINNFIFILNFIASNLVDMDEDEDDKE